MLFNSFVKFSIESSVGCKAFLGEKKSVFQKSMFHHMVEIFGVKITLVKVLLSGFV